MESGETILVTKHDRVVAEIVPPRESRSPRIEDVQLAEAVRNGLVSPPPVVDTSPPGRKPIAQLSEILFELEADRSSLSRAIRSPSQPTTSA